MKARLFSFAIGAATLIAVFLATTYGWPWSDR